MWMIRPWTAPNEIQIDLPDVIVDSLGSGAEVLASFLNQLTENGGDDSDNEVRPPPPVLCRICERQIQPWWFEKHTDLCLQEHRAEMDVQMAQENLTEHRHAIVKVLDNMEARQSRPMSGDQQQPLPIAEYKGMPIGPPPSTQSSPGTSMARSRDRSGGFGHSRTRSFAVRRPQARIVELLMDLCDTAIEISTPSLKENNTQMEDGDLRTQSPQSESRISQVLQWQSPSTNTLQEEQGLAHLCADTEKVARAKVDSVFRHRKIIEYAERIRIELAVMVQDCIDEAMREAARIAAGRYSDSMESDGEMQGPEETEGFPLVTHSAPEPIPVPEPAPASEPAENAQAQVDHPEEPEEPRGRKGDEGADGSKSGEGTSALAAALREASISSSRSRGPSRGPRPTSYVASTGSSSPKECLTPRFTTGSSTTGALPRDIARENSTLSESETIDSEGSLRSSSLASRGPAAAAPRTESPISEFGGDLRRAASSRRHHRRSLVLPGTSSPRRQESPSRPPGAPPSPLRVKPRGMPGSQEGLMIASPEGSPMLPNSEFSSPITTHSTSRHHRRQSSAAISDFVMKPPPSPRLNANQAPPQPRPTQPSIKDFEIIKPISKGAFGSVYLSKKKSTGEYFAIKVLKKADMVAKNQVGNVKAERAILMWQGQSEFVAKLYWTFSSKDYLYLVMEYLNGGDCASLIKVLGGLPEDWTKKYLAEVILGVEHLHSRGIIHRDLKPDNLLIDQKGHLKLTDFGLSRMGLIGRQKRALNSSTTDTTPDLLNQGPFARSASIASSRSTSLDLHGHGVHSPGNTPLMVPESAGPGQPSYFSLGPSSHEHRRVSSSHRSDSGGSESLSHMFSTFNLHDLPEPGSSAPASARILGDEEGAISGSPELTSLHGGSMGPRSSFDAHQSRPGSSVPQSNMMPPAMALFDPTDTNRRFVGTPDYLAPETINGDKQDETSDWWSVGCILFEFLYGVPPFNAGEAETVFENILARKIQWPPEDPDEPISDEAKDLINKLLCMDPPARLGSNREDKFSSGGEEIRSHPFFEGVDWDTLLEAEAQFVPQLEDPEDTEYFDPRGAVLQPFTEDMEDNSSPHSSVGGGSEYQDRPHDALSRVRSQVNSMHRKLMPLHIPPHVRDSKSRRLSEPLANDDFGTFAFKNLSVLEKANKELIQKLRAEALAAQSGGGGSSKGGSGSSGGAGGGAAGQQQAVSSSQSGSLDGSPVLANPVQRTMSNAKASHRPQSPSGYTSHSNSSPSRASQPSSPLMVSFVAGQGTEGRRKASSNSSNLSHQSGPPQPPTSLQPPSAPGIDIPPKVPPSLQKAATSASASASPAKGGGRTGVPPPPLSISPQKMGPPSAGLGVATPKQSSAPSTSRSRSLTVGSQEGSPVAATDMLYRHRSRKSQVLDMSPSSSDNEGGDKHNAALLRVQRRRQSSRRLSSQTPFGPFDGAGVFRPLDVLICEDHPVARMVMEKLLEKLRCRTISVATGSEAVRYSMSEIRFDAIFLEYRLPQINGADVARMIRETKNANSHTPIVAITAYLKELQAPHYFDSLIEKPISSSKLTEVLRSLCHWAPESPGQQRSPSGSLVLPPPQHQQQQLRGAAGGTAVPRAPGSRRADDSPTSVVSSFAGRSVMSSREDSVSSSTFGDSESVTTEEMPPPPVPPKRSARTSGGSTAGSGAGDDSLDEGMAGLGISESEAAGQRQHERSWRMMPVPQLTVQRSAPPQLERGVPRREDSTTPETTESADDEDEELGSSSSSASAAAAAGAASATSAAATGTPTAPRKQPRRSTGPKLGKPALPSSKLGIEMMRANSHDSTAGAGPSECAAGSSTGSSATNTPEAMTRVATTPEAQTTPPGEEGGGGDESGSGSVEVTPRVGAPSEEDLEATPRGR